MSPKSNGSFGPPPPTKESGLRSENDTKKTSSKPALTPEEWVTEFVQANGRRPRILHIGNIANNAYVNSKLLNEIGWDSDVLCYNYYHIMAYPEWEDADFVGQPKDATYPNWSQVDLHGFRRPKWFAQGPLEHGLSYLLARRTNDRPKALSSWLKMEVWRWVQSRHSENVLHAWETIQRARQPGQLWIVSRSVIRENVPSWVWSSGKRVQSFLRWPLKYFNPSLYRRYEREVALKPQPMPAIAELKPLEKFENPQLRQFIEDFARRFPTRADRLTQDDLEGLQIRAEQMRELMEHYDIIQGYSTDAIYPMLVNFPRYTAYEHGTIREIPFENSNVGRATALAYARAGAIIMTNADSIPQARRLQPDQKKITFGLHGFDERRLRRKMQNLMSRFERTNSNFRFGFPPNVRVFFGPSRHDWDVKGNDRVIRAVSQFAEKSKRPFKVVFVEWGQEIERSKRLITELKLEAFFHWISPIGKSELLMTYRNVDAVIDQFLLPCIGGVTIEALEIGESPVLTSLDDAAMTEFYGASIPLLNCSSVESIAARLQEVVDSDDRNRTIRDQCAAWMAERHNHRKVLEHLTDAYSDVLSSQGVANLPPANGRSWAKFMYQSLKKIAKHTLKFPLRAFDSLALTLAPFFARIRIPISFFQLQFPNLERKVAVVNYKNPTKNNDATAELVALLEKHGISTVEVRRDTKYGETANAWDTGRHVLHVFSRAAREVRWANSLVQELLKLRPAVIIVFDEQELLEARSTAAKLGASILLRPSADAKTVEEIFGMLTKDRIASPEFQKKKQNLAKSWRNHIPFNRQNGSILKDVRTSLGLLSCPNCRNDLRIISGWNALECVSCGLHFPFDAFDVDLVKHDDILGARRFAWRSWFESQLQSMTHYLLSPANNVSSAERSDVQRFVQFMGSPKDLTILDVGCGVADDPGYAESSAKLRVGLDPYIAETKKALDLKVRALSEFMPFKTASFDRVIYATSLDHVIDPELALRESKRILKPGGEIFIWDTMVKEPLFFSDPRYLQKFNAPASSHLLSPGTWLSRKFPRLQYRYAAALRHLTENRRALPGRVDEAHLYRLHPEALNSVFRDLGLSVSREQIVSEDAQYTQKFICLRPS